MENIEHEESWIDPLIKYLTEDRMTENGFEAKRPRVQAASFTIIDGQLYKRGLSMPYLIGLRPTEAKKVLFEFYAECSQKHFLI